MTKDAFNDYVGYETAQTRDLVNSTIYGIELLKNGFFYDNDKKHASLLDIIEINMVQIRTLMKLFDMKKDTKIAVAIREKLDKMRIDIYNSQKRRKEKKDKEAEKKDG